MSNEINAGSMADIAFLLLIFFLVTTTMNLDKGLLITLPEWSEEPPPIVDVKDRNTFVVVLNARDQLLVENEYGEVEKLREQVKEFIENPGNDPTLAESTTAAVISFKNDRGTSYKKYIAVWNELKGAYNELRDEYAQRHFSKTYLDLDKADQKKVRKLYPMKISEAEPEDIGGAASL
jgi:biopolymer transport protein ExbD